MIQYRKKKKKIWNAEIPSMSVVGVEKFASAESQLLKNLFYNLFSRSYILLHVEGYDAMLIFSHIIHL